MLWELSHIVRRVDWCGAMISKSVVSCSATTVALRVLVAVGFTSTAFAQTTVTSSNPTAGPVVGNSGVPLTAPEPSACFQQYLGEIDRLNQFMFDKENVFLGVQAAQVYLDYPGLVAEGLGEAGQPFTNPATVAGVAIQSASVFLTAAEWAASEAIHNIQGKQLLDLGIAGNAANFCDTTFEGTVAVTQGGMNVTGDSFVDGTLNVTGDLMTGGGIGMLNGIAITGGPGPQTATAFDGSAIAIGNGATTDG